MGTKPPPPKITRGSSSAYFAGWGPYVENGKPTLAISVTIDGARRTQKMIVPNMKIDDISINPPPGIAKLAKTLRIGDAVRFNYLIINDKVYAAPITLYKPLPRKPGAAPFTFIRSYTKRVGKNKFTYVIANAGVIPCTFRVAEGVSAAGKPEPSRKVTAALKKFCLGDKVELDYETLDYKFILKGISPCTMTTTGELTKITHRRFRGRKHTVAVIRTPKRTLTLTDTEPIITPKGNVTASTSLDSPIQTALKKLTPGDFVTFKYRRKGGIYWLDQIADQNEATPVASRVKHPTNRHPARTKRPRGPTTKPAGEIIWE